MWSTFSQYLDSSWGSVPIFFSSQSDNSLIFEASFVSGISKSGLPIRSVEDGGESGRGEGEMARLGGWVRGCVGCGGGIIGCTLGLWLFELIFIQKN